MKRLAGTAAVAWAVALVIPGLTSTARGCDSPQPPMVLMPTAHPNASPTPAFGWAFDADDESIIIGDPYLRTTALFTESNGLVEIFRRSAAGWEREASIIGVPSERGYGLGFSVAIAGDLAAALRHTGEVQVFERTPDGAWPRTATLAVSGALRVRIDAGRLYVRTIERILELTRTAPDAWTPSAIDVQPTIWTNTPPAAFAVDGDTLVCADAGLNTLGHQTPGVVRVYRRAPGGWMLDALLPDRPNPAFAYPWGYSAAVSGDTIAIGANYEPGPFLTGYVRIFRRDSAGSWNLEADLEHPSSAAGRTGFGISVALQADRLAVGAHLDDDGGPDSGAVHVFQRSAEGAWGRLASYAVSDSPAAQIGWMTAFSGAHIVASGLGVEGIGGAAVFDACSLPVDGDATPRCLPGVTGLLTYFGAYFDGDPFADFNHSGEVTVQDVFDFLAAWFAGCA